MRGFFTSIQSLLKTNYSGRYMAVVLKEVIQHDWPAFASFLKHRFGHEISLPTGKRPKITVTLEQSLSDSGRSDLAIHSDDRMLVLVELKFHDRLAPDRDEVDGQLKRYVAYCEAASTKLLVLTRSPLSIDERQELELNKSTCRHATYSALGLFLQRSNHQVSKLTLDYFEELGLIMQKVDAALLYGFFHRLLNPWKGARVASKQACAGPEQLSILLSNWALISHELTPRIHTHSATKRGATVDFAVHPSFHKKSLVKELEAAKNEDIVEIDYRTGLRAGGYVYVYAQTAIGTDKSWCYIRYGVAFEVDVSKNKELQVWLYADLISATVNKHNDAARRGKDRLDGAQTGYRSASKLLDDIANQPTIIADQIRKLIVKTIQRSQDLKIIHEAGLKERLEKTKKQMGMS